MSNSIFFDSSNVVKLQDQEIIVSAIYAGMSLQMLEQETRENFMLLLFPLNSTFADFLFVVDVPLLVP